MIQCKTHRAVTSTLTVGLTSLVAVLAVSASFLTLTADQAGAQELCSEYTIVQGDTLERISLAVGFTGGHQFLFEANTDVLDAPNALTIGQILKIPCADGSLPDTSPATDASVVTLATPATTRTLRIVAGNGYAPFTDEGLPGSGFFTQLVERSLQEGSRDQEYSLQFVTDWDAQLNTLLPTGAVDMALPWGRPDCEDQENLGPLGRDLCSNFNQSAPFYETRVGYYVRAGSPYARAETYEDLFGARLCRPDAWFTFDLEAERLVAPNITMVSPVPQYGCWELLMNGDVDVVTLDAFPAEKDYTALGLDGQVDTLEALTSKQTLHVFVAKDNAFANEALPIINTGLAELKQSGEWFTIVREGFRAAAEN